MFLRVWCGENLGLSTRLFNVQCPWDFPEGPQIAALLGYPCHSSRGCDWPTDLPVSRVEGRSLEAGRQVSAGRANECRSHGGCTFVMTDPKAAAVRAAGGAPRGWGDLFFGLRDGTVGPPLGRAKAAPPIPLTT